MRVRVFAMRKRGRRVHSRISWPFSSEPLAGVGVGHRHREETEAEDQHENIQHDVLLMRDRGRTKVPPRAPERPIATTRVGFRDGSHGYVIGNP